ncbi:VirB8/TrbF family protein [Variovorax sp. M-6]|uniref:VirB8/TrbF family protein n=1 Tax=Variovorax sp. M-6 TaxID=3233041 RepID=UPI003F97396B
MKLGSRTFRGDPATQAMQLGGTNKLKQERNRAYVAIVLLLLCVASLAFALTVFAKRHTFIPIITVQGPDGNTVRQTVVTPESIAGEESFVQSQVYAFVMACNTFDPAWRQRNADMCRLHATPQVASQYDAETSAENASNPYYQVGTGGRRFPRITGITSVGDKAYQVAYQLITEKPGTESKTEYFTALVRYTFTFKPLALGDRWENPLGFAATAYRKDQEFSRQ